MIEFMQQYGTEAKAYRALYKSRWPHGFRCPACGHHWRSRLTRLRRLKSASLRSAGVLAVPICRPGGASGVNVYTNTPLLCTTAMRLPCWHSARAYQFRFRC